MPPTKKAWSYILVDPPANLAVSLDDVKSWLEITASTQDDKITALIESATLTGEKISKRDFVNKTYKTFRDSFNDYPNSYGNYAALVPSYSLPSGFGEIELTKSRLQSVSSVKYFKENILTTVDTSVYYATEEYDYSRIALVDGKSWPDDVDNRQQAVVIEFVAGYGVDESVVPADIKTAIKQHVANALANRGDCSDSMWLPSGAFGVYTNNRIEDIV
jgi:hypothetical protein